MDVELLGPFSARVGDSTLRLTARKQRALLAMLAMHANEVVPVPALIEELWGDAAPRTVITTLQVYIMQLRNRIADAAGHQPDGTATDAKQVIVTHTRGYRLDTADGLIDVQEFGRLAEAGHRARELGDFVAASCKFTAALGVWRGPALVDVQVGSLLEVQVHQLEEARRNVLDRRIDADLRIGRHHQLLGELTGLVARHRTHEGLHIQLMLALARSGRRGEAMDVYRRLQQRLAEVGLESSQQVQEVLRMLLAHDTGPRQRVLTGHLRDRAS
jgi:DNA-binding SARP family transcriptional activator